MARLMGSRVRRVWLLRILCCALAACALGHAGTAAAAWHRYRLLLTLPPEHVPSGGEALLRADEWFGNLMGWRNAASAVSLLLLIAWLYTMRDLADAVWPEGQRRSRAWLVFGWNLPVANLFVPKMFVNDLWAAGQPGHRRGHPLLTCWWLSVLVAFWSSGTTLNHVPHAAHAAQAAGQMLQVMRSDALFVAAIAFTVALVWLLSDRLGRATLEVADHPFRSGE